MGDAEIMLDLKRKGQRRKEIKAGRKNMRRRSNGGTEARTSIILVTYETGVVINPKHRFSSTENFDLSCNY